MDETNIDLLSTDFYRIERFTKGKFLNIFLSELKMNESILWGFNPVSPIHFAYDKVFFLLKAIKYITNSKVRILSADVHSGLTHKLDNEQTNLRGLYYSFYLRSIWGIRHELIRASSYIFAEDAQYLKKLFTLLAFLDVASLKDTWPVAIKSKEPDARLLYAYIYPVMQVLDIFFLRPSIVFAEESQRKTYGILPAVSKLLNDDISVDFVYIKQSVDIRRKPLIGSKAKDRISIHERIDTLDTKLRHTFSSTELLDNPVLDLLEFSILPFDSAKSTVCVYMNTRTLTRLAVRNAVKDEVLVLPKAHTVLLDALVERSQTIESDYLRESPALLWWIDFEQVRKL